MTRPARLSPTHRTRPGDHRAIWRERPVSWSDFRRAVRYDPSNRLLVAVPAISEKRAEHAWLGEAVRPHTRVGDADVYRREYERGAVYWSERTGAHEVHGEIAARWSELGGGSSFLGLPTTDEQPLDGVHGGYAHFEGGSIYWTARHGAAVVHGMVRDIWALLGWERSALGLPVADVAFDRVTGEFSGCFEYGTVSWSPAGGPRIAVTAPAASDSAHDLDECDALERLAADFGPRA
ncbi:LGFP repeat-containing protein [Agromyces bauzanensis]